jgi:hypothetical protein
VRREGFDEKAEGKLGDEEAEEGQGHALAEADPGWCESRSEGIGEVRWRRKRVTWSANKTVMGDGGNKRDEPPPLGMRTR